MLRLTKIQTDKISIVFAAVFIIGILLTDGCSLIKLSAVVVELIIIIHCINIATNGSSSSYGDTK